MDLHATANLIKSEYAEKRAAAKERYLKLLDSDDKLLAAEKAMRAAILDDKTDEEIAELKRIRDSLIIAKGFSPDDFDPQPRCSICGDSGYNDGKYCDCVRSRASMAPAGSALPRFTLEDFDIAHFDGNDCGTSNSAYPARLLFFKTFPT